MVRTGIARGVVVSDASHPKPIETPLLAAMIMGDELCIRVVGGYGASAVVWMLPIQAAELRDLFAEIAEANT